MDSAFFVCVKKLLAQRGYPMYEQCVGGMQMGTGLPSFPLSFCLSFVIILRQGGYVFASVCLSVYKISEKVTDEFS